MAALPMLGIIMLKGGKDAVGKAIAALPEKQRIAVVMRRHQDLPYEDICAVLKMSLPAVKSLLFRARTELRKHLAAHLGEDVE